MVRQVSGLLTPTIAYQICASRSCPRKLKTEILGAFYMEPNIPEQTVHNQLQKLLISPLRKFAQDLTSIPVIIVLDSIHHCEDVKHIIIPIVQVINELQTGEHQVNMKFVITSVSYDYIFSEDGSPSLCIITSSSLTIISSEEPPLSCETSNTSYPTPSNSLLTCYWLLYWLYHCVRPPGRSSLYGCLT